MLAALRRRSRSAQPVDLGIARDDPRRAASKIAAGLEADVLILSGGVSAGVLDLVPSVLAELGVKQVFHKVNLKPGKPLWFGTFTASDGTVKPVFGLPGNPVSTLVCFELFVRSGARADGRRRRRRRCRPIERPVTLSQRRSCIAAIGRPIGPARSGRTTVRRAARGRRTACLARFGRFADDCRGRLLDLLSGGGSAVCGGRNGRAFALL